MFPNIENFARQTLIEYVTSGFVLNKLSYTDLSSEENPNKNLDRCIGVISTEDANTYVVLYKSCK